MLGIAKDSEHFLFWPVSPYVIFRMCEILEISPKELFDFR